MARRTQFVLVMVFLNSILVNRAESEYGMECISHYLDETQSMYI